MTPENDSLFTLQLAMQRLRFSQRRRLWREIQQRASQQSQMYVPSGQLIAWPDVLLYVSPTIIAEAIAAVEGAEETTQP